VGTDQLADKSRVIDGFAKDSFGYNAPYVHFLGLLQNTDVLAWLEELKEKVNWKGCNAIREYRQQGYEEGGAEEEDQERLEHLRSIALPQSPPATPKRPPLATIGGPNGPLSKRKKVQE
jgi:hypothetical protein